MKLYLVSLLFFLSFSFLFADPISPKYWPERGELVESISLDSGKNIPSGSTFTLHRLEGKQALVSLGRSGTHWISVDNTNIAELAQEIEKGNLHKPVPNLIFRIYKTLFIQDDLGNYHPISLKNLKDTEVILFYFSAGKDKGHVKRIKKLHEQYKAWKKIHPKFEMIMIQEDATVLEIKEKKLITWPTMAVHLSVAYSESLHLGQNDSPSFVLAGSNGNVIKRYSIKKDLADILSSISSILDSVNFN